MLVYAMQVNIMHDLTITMTLLITTTVLFGFLVIYHHLVYPFILRWHHNRQPTKTVQVTPRNYTPSANDHTLPYVTLVIPAYNEAQWIADKIRNLAALDYPAERLQIVIACDGCNDNTNAIAINTAKEAECQHLHMTVLNFPQNIGKVAVINHVINNLRSDLVALSDVSALISIDALLIAAERFKDPNVGVLNAHYQLLSPGSIGEAVYWQYQSQIKASEAAMGSTLGAHGAFYLFRRELFEPLAADTINDDFILPMKIVAAGYRAEYENSINALELEQSDPNLDQQRRRRIAAGNLQQTLRLKHLLLPRYKGVAFAFLSGKALRVLMPFLMLASCLGCLLLAPHYELFLWLFMIQVIAYGLTAWELIFKPQKSNKINRTLAYIVSGHLAGFIGALRYLFKQDKGHNPLLNAAKDKSH